MMSETDATNHGPAAVWLYRHGPLPVPRFQCVGWDDVPLADPEATAVGSRRLSVLIGRADAVYSSDLLRTRQTAEPLAEALALPVLADPALRELNFGEWDGKMWNDLAASGDERFQRFVADWSSVATPGGESFVDLERRVVEFWQRIAPRHAGETIVVVSHGGTLAALAIHLLGWSGRRAMGHMMDRGNFAYVDLRRRAWAWNFDPAKE